MASRITRFYRQQQGATVIEFAIVAPVVLLLLFGIIEFSLMMFVSSVIEGATANISRMSKTGALRSTNPDPQTRAEQDESQLRSMIIERGKGIIRDGNLFVQTRPRTSQTNTMGQAGELVIYVVRYDWKIITPIMSSLLGDDEGVFGISSTTAVVNEPFDD